MRSAQLAVIPVTVLSAGSLVLQGVKDSGLGPAPLEGVKARIVIKLNLERQIWHWSTSRAELDEIISCTKDAITRWDLTRGKKGAVLKLAGSWASMDAGMRRGRDHPLVLGGTDGSIAMVDLSEARLRWLKKGHTRAIWSVGVSPSGGGVTTVGPVDDGPDDYVRLWRGTSGALLSSVRLGNGVNVSNVCWSDDGSLIATGEPGSIVSIFKPLRLELFARMEGVRRHSDAYEGNSVDWIAPTTIAACNGQPWGVNVWDIATRTKRSFLETKERVNSISWSRQSKLLAIASESVYLWDPVSGRRTVLDGVALQPGVGYSARFSRSGRYLAVQLKDGSVEIRKVEYKSQQ